MEVKKSNLPERIKVIEGLGMIPGGQELVLNEGYKSYGIKENGGKFLKIVSAEFYLQNKQYFKDL